MTRQHLPAYDRRGGTGPTLVFLHYWGGSARTWRPVIDLLPGRDTLAIDFRGWSRSKGLPGPYTLRQLSEDTLAVLAAAGVRDYLLVGHSMGGKVAQLIAGRQPAGLRGLVLVASGPAKPADAVTPTYREGLSHAYDSVETVAGARDGILTASPLGERLAAQILEDSLSNAPEARIEWPLRGIAEDITEQTRRVRVPALVIAGEHDQVEPAEVLRDNLVPYLADARSLALPATGHLIPLEAPRALADAIAGFADGVLRSSSSAA
ncbi:alpha/beta fold hydrolase [Pseudolysinimonas sp.]|uniref:alpha/beta fold hydrolase n=1 Tax=Pseudolysinimonas sp. TaxID=2680009 RepID=UPI003F7FD1EF